MRLKNLFMKTAREVCPTFKVRDEMQETLNDIFDWCVMLERRYDPDKGLWLWGSIGIGKSTMLEIIRRFCYHVRPQELTKYRLPQPYSFRTTNAIEVCGEFARHGYAGLDTFIESRRQAFDELGSESIPTSYFGTVENVFQYILQRRYDKRFEQFTHVTTNLSIEQISEMYGARIYDRCKELFNFVEMKGATWRKKN